MSEKGVVDVGYSERVKRAGWVVRGLAACLLAVALVIPGGVGVASAAAKSSTPVRGGNLTVEYPATTWSALYPTDAAGSATADYIFYNLIFDSLYHIPAPGKPIGPGIATGWKTSANRLTDTITLRKGVKFQDGTPVNAQAVKWNLDYDLAPAHACWCLDQISQIKSVQVTGPLTIALHLSSPNGSLQDALAEGPAGYLLSPTAVKKEGTAKFGASPVGAGPFKVTTNEVDSKLVLTRWPGYYDAAHTYLDTITFLYTVSEPQAYNSVQAGQTQVEWGASPQTLETAKSSSNLKEQNPPTLQYSYFQINTKKAPFNNLKARQAVAYSINPMPLVDAIYNGQGGKVDALATPAMDFYPGYDPSALDYPTYNLAKAKALVKALGGLKFTLQTITNATATVALAQAIDKQLTAAGMQVTLNTPALAQGVASMERGSFQILLSGTGGYVDPDLYLPQKLGTGNAGNPGYSDPKMDKLLKEAAAAPNPTKKAAVFKQIFALSNKDLGFYPMFSNPSVSRVMTKNVEGIPDTVAPDLTSAWLSRG